jgi:predicted transcriptional regulator YheO
MDTSSNYMEFLDRIASMIAEMFGDKCETVISDLDHPEQAILYIYNGHVTDRKVGGPLTPEALARVQSSADSSFINYRSCKNGKPIKTSSLCANIDGHNIAFCINFDYAEMESIQKSLASFLDMHQEHPASPPQAACSDFTMQCFESAVATVGKSVWLMTKEDRLKVISYLYQHGAMRMQKSVQTIARELGVSRYTIYNYLNEIKAAEKPEDE